MYIEQNDLRLVRCLPNISEYAEADCFFCFTNLMSDIRDFFIKTLDEAESGINRMMVKLMDKIKLVDPDVEEQLIIQEIKPQFYSFRLHQKYISENPFPIKLQLNNSWLSFWKISLDTVQFRINSEKGLSLKLALAGLTHQSASTRTCLSHLKFINALGKKIVEVLSRKVDGFLRVL